LIAAFLSGSCMKGNSSEDRAVTLPSEDALLVEAEFLSEGDDVRSLVIRSNRSWFAHLNDLDNPVDPADPEASVPWGWLSVDHHSNLTNTSDETKVEVHFRRNYTRNQINGVLNIYSEGDIVASVPVTQSAAVWHLEAAAERSVAQCDEDVVPVKVNCNTDWTVRLDAISDADASIDITEGFDPGTVNVTFGENFDTDKDKKAVLVFSAEDCEDVVVEIKQNKAVPYIYILDDNIPDILAGETTASLFIRSNTSWTAGVLESELENFSIVNASGYAPGRQEVKVKFKPNPATDPSVKATASIRFNAAGVQDPVDYTFSQRGCLVIDFSDPDAFDPAIPVEYTGAGIRPGKTKDDVDTFAFNNGAGIYKVILTQYMRRITNSSGTWLYLLGAGIRPYIKFPGIEDLTLCKVSTYWRSLGSADQECAFAGNILTDDHPEKTAIELTNYINNISWYGLSSPKQIDFDLSETGQNLEPGRGCVLRFSHANAVGNIDRTRGYLIKVELKYR